MDPIPGHLENSWCGVFWDGGLGQGGFLLGGGGILNFDGGTGVWGSWMKTPPETACGWLRGHVVLFWGPVVPALESVIFQDPVSEIEMYGWRSSRRYFLSVEGRSLYEEGLLNSKKDAPLAAALRFFPLLLRRSSLSER